MIRTLSEINVLTTERRVAMADEQKDKGSTTVAMDFGRLTIDAQLQLYLFGTPGQKRFDFMWEILAEGMLGFVILVDAQRAESVDEAEEILEFFRHVAEVPYVVGVNKSEEDPQGAVDHARKLLRIPEGVRVVACNALDKNSVKDVLVELLYAVLEEVEAAEAAAV